MIVGVTGFATSGKDTAADVLVKSFGLRKISWADELRRDIHVLNPIVGRRWWGKRVRYRDAIERLGYTKAKVKYPELRRLLQDYGTEVHRALDEDYWVKRTLASVHPSETVVIPDTRFPNEAERCEHLLLVTRPGVGSVNGHASDAGLAFPYATHTIVNDGTLQDLSDKVISWWESIQG